MFSLLSMSPISDWLAPDLSPLEEFKTQYEFFLGYFTQQAENGVEICKCHMESTNLTMVLTKMCNLLVFEQAEMEKDVDGVRSLGSSIEFFLQSDIAHILAIYAQADAPLGLCPIILLFFNKLIADCKLDLLPHVSFHNAVNKLVTTCGRIAAGPYETYEIIFLQTLVEAISRSPHYINFFTQDDTFPLAGSLLALLQSPDSNISKQAGDCILELLHRSNDHALRLIVERSPFCDIVLTKVIQHYNDIPRTLNPAEIEVAITAIQLDQFSNTSFSTAVRRFLSFLKWYMFYDSIILHSSHNPFFTDTMITKIRTEFLESAVLNDLLGHGYDSPEDAIDNCFLTTVILLNCVKSGSSDGLSKCVGEIMTINDKGKYIPYHPNVAKSLISRCNLRAIYENNEASQDYKAKQYKLASATVQLFEKILSRPFASLIEKLLLNDLKDIQRNDNDKKEEYSSQEPYLKMFDTENLKGELLKVSKIARRPNNSNYRFSGDEKLCSILHFFDSLVPAEFRFGTVSDYQAYAHEALKGFNSYFESFPIEQPVEESPLSTSRISLRSKEEEEEEKEEALNFIQTFLDSLQYVPKLPYEVGVQLFACLAKVAMITDSRIDCKLLDSTVSDASETTLFNALHKLISELQINVSGIENLNDKLILIKKILLGEVKKKAEYSGTIEEQQILQSIIVVDEFCKEIAAIAFVKQKLFSCNDQSNTSYE